MNIIGTIDKTLNGIPETSRFFPLMMCIPILGPAVVTWKTYQLYRKCVADADNFDTVPMQTKVQKCFQVEKDWKDLYHFPFFSLSQKVCLVVSRIFFYIVACTLLPFPIAFLVAGPIFDVASLFYHHSLETKAYQLDLKLINYHYDGPCGLPIPENSPGADHPLMAASKFHMARYTQLMGNGH
jgi:hypothetical protein